jgi:hypothetical protein
MGWRVRKHINSNYLRFVYFNAKHNCIQLAYDNMWGGEGSALFFIGES